MPVVDCPRCRTPLNAPAESVGREAICAECQTHFLITAPPPPGRPSTGPRLKAPLSRPSRRPADRLDRDEEDDRPRNRSGRDEDDDEPTGSRLVLWLSLGAGFLGLLVIVLIAVLAGRGKRGTPAVTAAPDSLPAPVREAVMRTRAELSPEEVYQQLLHSTAWVLITDGRRVGSGSGALVDAAERLVLTNYHVVEGADRALVYFPDYRDSELVTRPQYYVDNPRRLGVAGKVVARDAQRDLALVQLESVPGGVTAVPLADRGTSPGKSVYSIGASGVNLRTAEGVLWRYTIGQVRQVYEQEMRYENGQVVRARTVETQAPTNRGDSGGPVVNDRGELVAVVSGGSNSERLVSINIDLREVRDFLKEYSAGQTDAGPTSIIPALPSITDAPTLPRIKRKKR